MKIIAYTRAGGFVETEFDPSWEDGEDEAVWLKRAGFERYGGHDGLDSQREYGKSVSIHPRDASATGRRVQPLDLIDRDGKLARALKRKDPPSCDSGPPVVLRGR